MPVHGVSERVLMCLGWFACMSVHVFRLVINKCFCVQVGLSECVFMCLGWFTCISVYVFRLVYLYVCSCVQIGYL